jgi:hypothetical protein
MLPSRTNKMDALRSKQQGAPSHTFWLTLAAIPIGTVLASLAFGIHRGSMRWNAAWNMAPALGCGLLNFWLSFLRPLIFKFRNGSMNKYKFESGIPALGNIFVQLGAMNSFGSVGAALLGLVAVLIDTGGFPWFYVCLRKQNVFK